MINQGEVKLFHSEVQFDYISPDDIGEACGILLARGSKAAGGKNVIPMCGPQLLSQKEAVGVIGGVLGKDIKVTDVTEEESFEVFAHGGTYSETVTKDLIKMLKLRAGDDGPVSDQGFSGQAWKEAAENLEKYSERPATNFR